MGKDKSRTTLRGRDAKTGEFVRLEETKRRPESTLRERVPKPGHGDTGKGKRGKDK